MRIVQIGLGPWGEKNSEILSQMGALSGICEKNQEKGKSLAEKYSVSFFDSIDKAPREEFDAVCIDSSIPDAVELASNLLYDKKHVFADNSLTENSAELEKLREISEKKKVLFSCYYPNRFNSEIKKNLASKEFGEIISLEIFQEKSKNIFQELSNAIDVANQIFEEKPLMVFSKMFPGDEVKFANIMLGYLNNKSATILSREFSSNETLDLRLIFSEKTVKVDLNNQNEKDPNVLQLENFTESIEGKKDVVVSLSDIVSNVKIMEAAHLSSKQGVPIYLDLK